MHPLKSSSSFVCIASSCLFSVLRHRFRSLNRNRGYICVYCQKQNDVIYCGRQLSLFVHTLDLSVASVVPIGTQRDHRASLKHLSIDSQVARDPPIQYLLSQRGEPGHRVFHLAIVANTKRNENHLHSRNKAKVLIMLRHEGKKHAA